MEEYERLLALLILCDVVFCYNLHLVHLFDYYALFLNNATIAGDYIF